MPFRKEENKMLQINNKKSDCKGIEPFYLDHKTIHRWFFKGLKPPKP